MKEKINESQLCEPLRIHCGARCSNESALNLQTRIGVWICVWLECHLFGSINFSIHLYCSHVCSPFIPIGEYIFFHRIIEYWWTVAAHFLQLECVVSFFFLRAIGHIVQRMYRPTSLGITETSKVFQTRRCAVHMNHGRLIEKPMMAQVVCRTSPHRRNTLGLKSVESDTSDA